MRRHDGGPTPSPARQDHGARTRARFLVVVVCAAVGVVACASPRASLGTSRSPCFQALPIAAAAVNHQGHFAGVTRITGPGVARLPGRLSRRGTSTTQPAPTAPSTAPTAPSTAPATSSLGSTSLPSERHAICLVAFRGTFDRRSIPLFQGTHETGTYAIVVVGVRARQARAVFLTDHLPKSFRHL